MAKETASPKMAPTEELTEGPTGLPPAFLGIDVSKKKLDAALVREGKKTHFKAFPNTPDGQADLLKWLVQHQAFQAHICLEATGTFAEEAATALHDAGHTVSVVNPARIPSFLAGAEAGGKAQVVTAARFSDAQAAIDKLYRDPRDVMLYENDLPDVLEETRVL